LGVSEPRRLPEDMGPILQALGEADPALKRAIKAVGAFVLPGKPADLQAFVRAIIGQQLSVKVAGTISDRLCLQAGRGAEMTPESILCVPMEQMRAVGLSQAKAESIRALAAFWRDQELSAEKIEAMADEELVALLTQVRGIGPWTVKMVQMFCLRRPDILPVEDLGLKMGIQRLDGLAERPTVREMVERAEVWRPWRSVATWYLWKLLLVKGEW